MMSFFCYIGQIVPEEGKVFPPIDTIPETVFYTMSVYFLAAKVTKTRYTLAGALLSTLAGTAASVVMARWMG